MLKQIHKLLVLYSSVKTDEENKKKANILQNDQSAQVY